MRSLKAGGCMKTVCFGWGIRMWSGGVSIKQTVSVGVLVTWDSAKDGIRWDGMLQIGITVKLKTQQTCTQTTGKKSVIGTAELPENKKAWKLHTSKKSCSAESSHILTVSNLIPAPRMLSRPWLCYPDLVLLGSTWPEHQWAKPL